MAQATGLLGAGDAPLTDVEAGAVLASLERMGLTSDGVAPIFTTLAGGVSSRIVKVGTAQATFCFKQALAQLKVAADWHAPTIRNLAEVRWMRTVGGILPGLAPGILGEDREAEAFAMTFFDAASYPLWKASLLAGRIDLTIGEAVGRCLGTVHAHTARNPDVARQFANASSFYALRIEPYLLATASAHPDLAQVITAIATQTSESRLALVHGDVAPKNLLEGGEQGVVILDAECATYGDPAFDIAFCLNHILLKMALMPHHADGLAGLFAAIVNAYGPHVDWEPFAAIDGRAGRLLPALMLARVDGKSPVEYLDDTQRGSVRNFARSMLSGQRAGLLQICHMWKERAIA